MPQNQHSPHHQHSPHMAISLDVSRFIRRTLLPDEKLIKDARFHWFYTFSAFFIFAFCLAIGFGVQYLMWRFLGQWDMRPVYAGVAIGLWMFFWTMMKKWTTEIILTDKRLLYKRGFFQVDVAEVDIEQLASDYVQQSLLGRLLDYGAIRIRCVEASDVWLPPIANPYEFRNALEQQKHLFREHYMKVERLRHHGMNPSDISEA